MPELIEVDIEHHHDEQEQHHHRAHVDEHEHDREELRFDEEPDRRRGDENTAPATTREYTGLRATITPSAAATRMVPKM